MTLRETGAQALHAYRGFIASSAGRKPQPHELDPLIAGRALWESLRGFPKAAVSPYVIDKMTKCVSFPGAQWYNIEPYRSPLGSKEAPHRRTRRRVSKASKALYLYYLLCFLV